MWPSPRKLCGSRLTLLPLSHGHAAQLAQATCAGPHIPEGCRLPVRHEMQLEISHWLERQADGLSLIYSIQSPSSRLLGWVGFSQIDRAHKKLTIDNLWLASEDHSQFVEMIAMLLTFGFEVAGANTIQLPCLASNAAHRTRVEGLGASLDGVLRGEKLAKDGRPQDVAVYSLIKSEWPQKSHAILSFLQ